MKIGAGSSVLQMEERAMKHYQFLRSAYGLLILVFVISGLTLVGCSSTESRLVGKWKEKGGTEVLEFFKDGRPRVTPGVRRLAVAFLRKSAEIRTIFQVRL
jgi:hypothetical protein